MGDFAENWNSGKLVLPSLEDVSSYHYIGCTPKEHFVAKKKKNIWQMYKCCQKGDVPIDPCTMSHNSGYFFFEINLLF